jgi:hypothetical protein
LKFVKSGLSFQEYIGLNFALEKAKVESYDKVYIKTWQEAFDKDEPVEETIYGELSGTRYVYNKKVLAWSMTEMITITLYAEKDGIVYEGETVVRSVESAAKGALEKQKGNAKVCAALVDMLNYGAMVQTLFSHNEKVLPNTNLGDFANMGTQTVPTISKPNSVVGTGAVELGKLSLSMQDKVEFNIKVDADISAYEVRVTVAGTTSVISGAEVTKTGVLRVAVAAANMREDHVIALYNAAGERVSPEYIYSIEGSVTKLINNGTYGPLVISILRYGDSVRALLG